MPMSQRFESLANGFHAGGGQGGSCSAGEKANERPERQAKVTQRVSVVGIKCGDTLIGAAVDSNLGGSAFQFSRGTATVHSTLHPRGSCWDRSKSSLSVWPRCDWVSALLCV